MPSLLYCHRPQLDQEGVPGVALVRSECGERIHLVGHERGVDLG